MFKIFLCALLLFRLSRAELFILHTFSESSRFADHETYRVSAMFRGVFSRSRGSARRYGLFGWFFVICRVWPLSLMTMKVLFQGAPHLHDCGRSHHKRRRIGGRAAGKGHGCRGSIAWVLLHWGGRWHRVRFIRLQFDFSFNAELLNLLSHPLRILRVFVFRELASSEDLGLWGGLEPCE